MGFGLDLPASARRHLEAANYLRTRRPDVAGYLFGIAAECAIKAMMLDANIRPMDRQARRQDPFFAHFPELRTMLRDMKLGRGARSLLRYVEDASFMNNWSTDMRYAHGRDVQAKWVDAWAEHARQAVASIGT